MTLPCRTRATDVDGPVTQEFVRTQYARRVNGRRFRELRAENLRRFQAFQRRSAPST